MKKPEKPDAVIQTIGLGVVLLACVLGGAAMEADLIPGAVATLVALCAGYGLVRIGEHIEFGGDKDDH